MSVNNCKKEKLHNTKGLGNEMAYKWNYVQVKHVKKIIIYNDAFWAKELLRIREIYESVSSIYSSSEEKQMRC